MDQPVFDATSFVAFDLDKGTIHTPLHNGLALVPLDILAALEPNEALSEIARGFGKTYGNDLKQKTDDGGFGNDFEILADHLTGTLATLGLGRLSIEIHGAALLFRLVSEDVKDGCNAILCGFLGGYLEAITGYDFEVVVVQESGETYVKTLWAGNPETASELKTLLEEGVEPVLALEKLSERSAS